MLPPDFKLQRLDTMPVEPLSLVEAKLYLRVETPADDLLIPDLITAARIKCEQIANASLTTASWRLTCDYLPWGGIMGYWQGWTAGLADWWTASTIELPNPPLVAVQDIRYVALDGLTHLLDPSAYRVSPGTPGQVQPAYGTFWPFLLPEIAAVQIDYTAGPQPDKVACVKAAMRLLVNHLYVYRATDQPIPEQIGWILDPVRNYGYA